MSNQINREGYFVTETERECTSCGVIFKKTSKTVALCPVCNSKRVKSQDPVIKMWRRAKSRAKNKGLTFTIEPSDIIIPEFCPIMKVPLVIHKGRSGGERNSPALDRIDSSKGYTKDNIWVISHLANMMKSVATNKDLRIFADWIIKNIS